MIYRALDGNGDYVFGHGLKDFLKDSPEAVGQAVMTRLDLLQGEWFLDETEGTPYETQVLGTGKQMTYDLAIQDRILGTKGVTQITAYSSTQNPDTRKLSISATIGTVYGLTTIQAVL